MELRTQETPDGVRLIHLSGRMDIAGTNQIHQRFTEIVGTEKALVVVDLAEVTFLSSLGMRTLVSNAHALLSVGGNMVVANPQPSVRQVLATAGIDSLIPAYPDIEKAKLGLLALKR